MDRRTGIFVDGIGASAASSGVLNALQGRIFGLLYLESEPLSLEEIAARLGQSKSNISINIRGLTDWHLVRLVHVPGSRRDHYEAATDLVRVMQEIMERRFRWNMRQVLTTIEETRRIDDPLSDEQSAFLEKRLGALQTFFRMMDGIAAMLSPGSTFPPALVPGGAATTPASPTTKSADADKPPKSAARRTK